MVAKPKPKKADRPKKKPHVRGICPVCGTIFHSTQEAHTGDCPRSLPVIKVRKNQTEVQLLKMAMDELCRQITAWRDGCNCVLTETNGRICDGTSQWGHVIPQGSCSWLVYNLSNSFRQCASHNGLHRNNQLPYFLWYQFKFGRLALSMLQQEQEAHPINLEKIVDLYYRHADLSALFQNMAQMSNPNIEELVDAGYYGPIIKEAWIKEGRI